VQLARRARRSVRSALAQLVARAHQKSPSFSQPRVPRAAADFAAPRASPGQPEDERDAMAAMSRCRFLMTVCQGLGRFYDFVDSATVQIMQQPVAAALEELEPESDDEDELAAGIDREEVEEPAESRDTRARGNVTDDDVESASDEAVADAAQQQALDVPARELAAPALVESPSPSLRDQQAGAAGGEEVSSGAGGGGGGAGGDAQRKRSRDDQPDGDAPGSKRPGAR
jgi:hypothetical protein